MCETLVSCHQNADLLSNHRYIIENK